MFNNVLSKTMLLQPEPLVVVTGIFYVWLQMAINKKGLEWLEMARFHVLKKMLKTQLKTRLQHRTGELIVVKVHKDIH